MEVDPHSNVRTPYIWKTEVKSCQSSHITSVSGGSGRGLRSLALKPTGLSTQHWPNFILKQTAIQGSPWCDGASIYRKVETWENGPCTTEGHDHWPGKGGGAQTLAHILSGPLTSTVSLGHLLEMLLEWWAPHLQSQNEHTDKVPRSSRTHYIWELLI